MILPCLILGDSIAEGTSVALRAFEGPTCAVVSQVGASTPAVARSNPGSAFGVTILSAGSNDAAAADLPQRLASLRRTVVANHVVWLLPYNRRAAGLVRQLATAYGDGWIDLEQTAASRDGVHPASYVAVAAAASSIVAASEGNADPVPTPGVDQRSTSSRSSGVWGETAAVTIFR